MSCTGAALEAASSSSSRIPARIAGRPSSCFTPPRAACQSSRRCGSAFHCTPHQLALGIISATSAADACSTSMRCMASTTPEAVAAAAPGDDGGEASAAAAKPLPLVLVVAVVLLDDRGRVLLAQRPPGKKLAGLWEFPGGKVDPGESPEAALVRELLEELGIGVAPAALRPLTFASHAYETFHLLMPTYECTEWEGEPSGQEGQAVAWVSLEELEAGRYAMPPADLPMLPPVLAAMRVRRAAATAAAAEWERARV